jgi:hypothetical protein
MPEAFDLNIFPILRLNGQDQTAFPGLFAATPPRRTARGRDRDNLVLYLSLDGPAWLPPEQQTQLLTRLAQMYYKNSGPVTSVLRKTAETLNRSLLEWNNNHAGAQVSAFLTQMVVRDDLVYLSHSGPGHAYVMTPESVRDHSDADESGRGLGFDRITVLRFFQIPLKGSEEVKEQGAAFILLTHQPGEVWQVEDLQIAPNQGMESMRRKLLVGRSDSTLNAVLIQVVPGAGKLRFLRLKPSFQDMARPLASEPPARQKVAAQEHGAPAGQTQQAAAQPGTESRAPAPSSDEAQSAPTSPAAMDAQIEAQEPEAGLSESRTAPAPLDAAAQPEQAEGSRDASAVSGALVQPQPDSQEVPAPPKAGKTAGQASAVEKPNQPAHGSVTGRPKPPRSQPQRQRAPKISSAMAELSREIRQVVGAGIRVGATFQAATANAMRQIGGFLFTWLKRLLPDESMLNLSPRTLIFIAIAAPLVVSVIGGMVYIEHGQATQFQLFYDQAVEAAAQATAKTDPLEQRLALQSTLELLDKAEFYRQTTESQTLRSQARGALDLLDGIERLDYRPALQANLDKMMRITRIATHGGDLYLLNGSQGYVIRAVLTGGGYQIDTQFVCGPVGSGASVVGPLVDIVPLPRGEESKATVLGIDASGTLILCIPGQQPLIQPVNPPSINFGEIRAFDLNTGDLYYLDPPQNAVWIYRRRETINPPRLFFGEQIPHMQNVVDLTVNGDDLYLLHADGHQSLCAYLPDSATRCDDPINYVDMRPGRSGGPVIPDALFTQLQFAPPPDPSLYLLEPGSQAIYHFSLRLTLQRQFRPNQPLSENPATAFAISANRVAFLAIGNQVYYAALP